MKSHSGAEAECLANTKNTQKDIGLVPPPPPSETGVKRSLKALDERLGYALSSAYSYCMHGYAKRRFHRYMQQNMGHFLVPVDPGPIGDEEIILRTTILREDDIQRRVNPYMYFGSGYSTMLVWLKCLERFSFNIRTASAIMELGCGSARLIRHLRCMRGVRLIGSDVKPEFIAWCQANVPGIEFHANDLRPPLAFAETNSIDLIFAQSVFTHIPLDLQDLWIEELHRILRPGGFLLTNVTGHHREQQQLGRDDLTRLDREGHVTLYPADPGASLSTQIIGSWDVFQSREEVLNAFGSMFHVRDYIPDVLDLLVLQKQSTL